MDQTLFERCLARPQTACRWINQPEIRLALKAFARGHPPYMDWVVRITEISARYCRRCPERP